MKITFLELALTNFGAYRERQVINLSFVSDEGNIILFFGKNGQGKTTLLDAIRLVIYGEWANCSSRGKMPYSAFLSEAINYRSSDDEKAILELTFYYEEYLNSCNIKVERIWKRKDKKDTLKVYRDGNFDEALTANWQEWISATLPIGISSLFLFDGEQVRELAESDTPTLQMQESINELLGLTIPQTLLKDLDILAKRKRKELASITQLDDLNSFEEQIKDYKAQDASLDNQIKAQKQHLGDLQAKLSLAEQKFIVEGGKAASEQATLQQQLQLLETGIAADRDRLRELAAGKLPLLYILPLLQQAEVNLNETIASANYEIVHKQVETNNQRLLDRLRSMNLDLNSLSQIEQFVLEELTLPQVKPDVEIFDNDPDLAKSLASTLALVPQSSEDAQSLVESITSKKQEITVVERRLAVAAPDEIFGKLHSEVKQLQSSIVSTQTKLESLEQEKSRLQLLHEETCKRLQEYCDTVLSKQDGEHKLRAIAKAQDTTKKYIEVIKAKRLGSLRDSIVFHYQNLLHKSDFIDGCIIDPNTYAITLLKDGKVLPRHRLSAGEKQIFAIAIFHGLAKVSNRSFPVVIDTPLGRLDTLHRQSLIEKYFQEASHQVVLLSTDTEITESELKQLQISGSIAKQYHLEFSNTERRTLVRELLSV